VHVTLNRDDSDGTVIVWSGAHAATDKKHTLEALVNQTMKGYVQAMTPGTQLSATRVSALGFLGWGVRSFQVDGAGATGKALPRTSYCYSTTLLLNSFPFH